MNSKTKYRTYPDFFSGIDVSESFCVKLPDANSRQALVARITDKNCVGGERFFGAQEDMLATAKVREVRRYARGLREYVRYEFKVLDPHGDWSDSYQLLALFSKDCKLEAYTIVRGRIRKTIIPKELYAKDVGHVYIARELKRALMRAKRLNREMSIRTLNKIGVDDTHDRMAFRVATRDLSWRNIIKGWRKHGARYRDNVLVYLAMRGDSNAMCEVGHWLDVTKEESEYWSDPELAAYWFRKAADAGNPMGQYRLATLLAGDCDKLDLTTRDEMLLLLKAAAVQDFPSALDRLSKCYRCDHCGLYDSLKAAEYRLRYDEIAAKADSSGRLKIHRNKSYGKMYEELQV